MKGNILILIGILLPIILGAIFPALKCLKTRKAKMTYYVSSLVVSVLLASAVLYRIGGDEITVCTLTDGLTIAFRVDRMSMLFAWLTSFVWLCAGIYAVGYMKHEEREETFFAFYLMVYGVLIGLDCSANLLTMYMFYEFMTLSSLPLVLHERNKEAVMAGLKYLFYSVAGAFLALFFLFVIISKGASADFVAGGNLLAYKNDGLMLTATFLAIVGFGCKAGMFPLHAWLPTAHPVAPTPASAVLSGVITKAGVIAVIRIVFYVAGAEFIRGTWVQTAWMSLTLFTVFMGSMLAYKEPLLKKRLAYSSVSQVSYILFGLSVLEPVAAVGALLHVIYHSLIKNTLFLTAGSYIMQTGCKRVDELRGIGKRMPATTWCFTIAGLALVGIPPLSGFVSKWYLASGCLNSGTGFFVYAGPVVLLVSALLTAGYLLPVTVNGFLPGKYFPAPEKTEIPAVMLVPIIILVTGAALLGIFAAPLYNALFGVLL